MVYMAADNNLESQGIADFLEMAQAGSNSNVNILVQFDRASGYDTTYGDWTTAKRFRIRSGMTPVSGNALQDLGEVDMGNQAVLEDFITWGKSNYPAQKYALVIWNHGGGWYPQELDGEVISQGVAWDATGGYLSNDELHGALSTVTSNGSQKLELIAFDACRMANIEVDVNLQDFVINRVSSETDIPGTGFPYHTILADLKATPAMTGETLAGVIVNRYYAYYGSDVTLSAIRFIPGQSLALAVDNLAHIMADNITAYRNQIYNSYLATNYFVNDPPAYDNVDLYGFASALKARVPSGTQIWNAANSVTTKMDGMLIANRFDAAHWPGAHGTTIYFPWSSTEWASYKSDYNTYQLFPQTTYWDEFLDIYYP